MTRSRAVLLWRLLIAAFIIVAVFLVALQIWSAISVHRIVTEAETHAAQTRAVDIEHEKTRAEIVSAEIENQTRGLIATTMAAQFGGLAAALVTISGGILAVLTYLSTREKDREDRLATALSETLGRLVSKEERERIMGAAGLLPFFTADRAPLHSQALGALVAAARVEEEQPQVRQALRLTIERALPNVDPAVARSISWQNVKLPSIDLRGRDLSGFDLRDADLQDAMLQQVNLSGANLENTQLQGSNLEDAVLNDANLSYADLAGALFGRAQFSRARLDGVKVLDVDLNGAVFSDIGAGWRGLPWDATRNWRQATFDDAVRAELDAKYGEPAPPLQVLMLMWEMPPLVAGGTWTACYHLVRKLARRGANVTVLVPWERDALVDLPFGIDVRVEALGIALPQWSGSPYATMSGYSNEPYWSPYATSSPYGGPYGSYSRGLSGSVLFRLMNDFTRRVAIYARDQRPDVIHAHDWVTFEAAAAAAGVHGTPWVAHFHSTEAERQLDRADSLTMRIEQKAVEEAASVVVPSNVTKSNVSGAYGGGKRINVVPNVLSEELIPTADMGRFESKRVVFIGRLSPQKGVDRFCIAAANVQQQRSGVTFDIFGDGEERSLDYGYVVHWRGGLPWNQRSAAYRNSSIVVVPSRAEPFGMVILEAMQHQVPAIYADISGAAEVLESGIKVNANDTDAIAARELQLLADFETWENVATAEAQEIEAYAKRPYEDRLIAVWQQVQAR